MLFSELAQIASGDIEIKGTTVLMYLASKGRYTTLCVLLQGTDKPLDINAQDENGYTALCWALSANHIPILELLIAKGADIAQALKNFPDPEKQSLLQRIAKASMPRMKIGKE